MFYLRHSSGLQAYFTNTIPLHSPAKSTSSVLFSDYDGTVLYCWFTKLKPALLR